MNAEERVAETHEIWGEITSAAAPSQRALLDVFSETHGTRDWIERSMEAVSRYRILSASPDTQEVPIPKAAQVKDNVLMSEPLTRPELDAKLETVEAKMDGRLARIEDRFTSIDRQFAELRAALAEQRSVAWKAAGTTIAIIVGAIIAAFILSFNAFNSGRETSKMALQAQATATQAQQETAAALTQIRQIVSDLKAAQTAPASTTTAPQK